MTTNRDFIRYDLSTGNRMKANNPATKINIDPDVKAGSVVLTFSKPTTLLAGTKMEATALAASILSCAAKLPDPRNDQFAALLAACEAAHADLSYLVTHHQIDEDGAASVRDALAAAITKAKGTP